MPSRLGAVPIDDLLARLEILDRGRGRLHLEMLAAALAAVDPEAAVARVLTADPGDAPVLLVGLGKAAPAMARGAVSVLGSSVVGGIVVSNHRADVPPGLDLVLAGHPTPDGTSLEAGRRLLNTVSTTPRGARIIFLVSGGGSALAEVPAAGLTMEDIAATVDVLLSSGAPIDEVNTVRTHMSGLKGGRLAAASQAPATTILISDVAAAAAHLIASGPTLPCRTKPADAIAILEKRGLIGRLPRGVIDSLAAASPPPEVAANYVIAADGSRAATAAADAACARGIEAAVVGPPLAGSAAATAMRSVEAASEGRIVVLAGETTVEVRGGGKGGRNQEAALAAAKAIQGGSTMFTTLGSDGIDGPTDAAGAMVDGATAARIRACGIEPDDALAANDSHPALGAAGALIRCGPTGTNVADIWLVDRR